MNGPEEPRPRTAQEIQDDELARRRAAKGPVQSEAGGPVATPRTPGPTGPPGPDPVREALREVEGISPEQAYNMGWENAAQIYRDELERVAATKQAAKQQATWRHPWRMAAVGLVSTVITWPLLGAAARVITELVTFGWGLWP